MLLNEQSERVSTDTPLAAGDAFRTVYTPQGRLPAGPLALAQTFLKHRELIWQMARREVVGRYKGSIFGLMWSFFYPLLMLGVYTFAFSYVFRVSAPVQSKAPAADFALYAFSGLILFTLFTEVITRSPTFVVHNANYVKKVVFPVEIFPWVHLFSGLIHAAISTAILLGALLAINHTLPWTLVLTPLAVLPLGLVILGLAWILSSLGVYLRDVAQTIGIIAMMLMYLSPVFYTLDLVNNSTLQNIIRLNPLTIPMESFRHFVLRGEMPDWRWLGGYYVAATLVAAFGFWFFQRTRRGFADVL